MTTSSARTPASWRTCAENLPVAPIAIVGLGTFLAYGFDTGSFVLPKWCFLQAGAFIAAITVVITVARGRVIEVDTIDLCVFAFFLYAAASLAWSPDTGAGVIALAGILAAAIVFTALRRVGGERLGIVLAGLSIASALVILLRIAMGAEQFGGFGNPNVVAEFLILLLPYLASWWFLRNTWDRWIGPLGAAVVIAYLFGGFNPSKEVFLGGAAIGISILLLFRRKLSARPAGIVAGLLIVVIAFGLVVHGWKRGDAPISLQARVELSSNTFFMWLDRPLVGHGLGSFEYVYPHFMASYRKILPDADPVTVAMPLSFAEAAHNEPLQLLAELGILGFILIAILVVMAIRQRASQARKSAVDYAAAIQLSGVGAMACFDYVFQNPAILLLSMSSLALFAATNAPDTDRRYSFWKIRLPALASVSFCALILLLGSAAALTTVLQYVSQRHYALTGPYLTYAPAMGFEQNRKAFEAFPLNPTARRQLFISLSVWLSTGDAVPYSIEQQEDIYRISASTGPEWPGLLLTRTIQLLATGQQQKARSEIESILESLKRRAANLPDVYFTEALYALRTDDVPRAQASLDEAARRIARGQDSYRGADPQMRLAVLREQLQQRKGASSP